MKTIKFRGKRIDNGEWVYGNFSDMSDIVSTWFFIELAENGQRLRYMVDPETVGQFTGLTDKNGKHIYEGDIVHYEGITSNGNPVIRKVIYNEERCQFMAEMYQIECPSMVKCTIIGNIHDNPELLTP